MDHSLQRNTPLKRIKKRQNFRLASEELLALRKLLKILLLSGEYLKGNGAKKVVMNGFCWGGKVAVSSGGENTPFSAAAIVHPAMLSVSDVNKLTIPLAIYISKDEPWDECRKFLEVLIKSSFADKIDRQNYDNMNHGWAAARADLNDPENKKEFEDVYKRLVDYIRKVIV